VIGSHEGGTASMSIQAFQAQRLIEVNVIERERSETVPETCGIFEDFDAHWLY
jgi:hypothetical protein